MSEDAFSYNYFLKTYNLKPEVVYERRNFGTIYEKR